MRYKLVLLLILISVQSKSQSKGAEEWLKEVKKSVFCVKKVEHNPLAKFDLTERDTSGYNNGIFMFHTYIGTIGKDYRRVLAAIEPVAKVSDSSYSFKMAVKNEKEAFIFEGIAILEHIYQYKSLVPILDDEFDKVENYFVLVRLKAENAMKTMKLDGYYTFYVYFDRGQINIVPGAARSVTPYGDVFAGEIKENGTSVFLQLVPDTYLLGSLPVKKSFLEIDKFQSDMADFDICRINKKYLNNGWQFTHGEWINTSHRVEKAIGVDVYGAIDDPIGFWNK